MFFISETHNYYVNNISNNFILFLQYVACMETNTKLKRETKESIMICVTNIATKSKAYLAA